MVGNSHGSLEGMWEGAGGRLEAVMLEGAGRQVIDWRLTLTRAVLSGTPPSGLFSVRLLGCRGSERGWHVGWRHT